MGIRHCSESDTGDGVDDEIVVGDGVGLETGEGVGLIVGAVVRSTSGDEVGSATGAGVGLPVGDVVGVSMREVVGRSAMGEVFGFPVFCDVVGPSAGDC